MTQTAIKASLFERYLNSPENMQKILKNSLFSDLTAISFSLFSCFFLVSFSVAFCLLFFR